MGRSALGVLAVALVVGAYACGEMECSKADRDGIYRVTTTKESGTCADLGSFLAQYVRGEPALDAGCSIDYLRLSENDCHAEYSATCDSVPDDMRVIETGVYEQQDEDGKRFTGTCTIIIKALSSGASICVATYKLEAVRQ